MYAVHVSYYKHPLTCTATKYWSGQHCTTQFCSLWTLCLEWSVTDSACITRHTQTVSGRIKDNTVLFSLRDMIWHFRALFRPLRVARYNFTYLLLKVLFSLYTAATASTRHQAATLSTTITNQGTFPTSTQSSTANEDAENSGLSGKLTGSIHWLYDWYIPAYR